MENSLFLCYSLRDPFASRIVHLQTLLLPGRFVIDREEQSSTYTYFYQTHLQTRRIAKISAFRDLLTH